MKYEIVVLNSKGGAGKDTFFGYCESILGNCTKHISTVDCVKGVAKKLGWDGTKTMENRRRLSLLKDMMTAWGVTPINWSLTHPPTNHALNPAFSIGSKIS